MEVHEEVEIVGPGDVFDLYGRWNGILATNVRGEPLGVVSAHDGDFFPESVMDYVEALREDVAGSGRGRCYPLRVDIDITQICNARCVFCFSRPYQDARYRGQSATAEVLADVIAGLGRGGSKSLRFCGGGDPLVHPDIDRLLPLAHAAGMLLCVISNLDFLDEARTERLVEHVDHLRWSVNAATDETRLRLHRPSRNANPLSETTRRVEQLVARRRGRRPMVWSTFLVMPDNYCEVPVAARRLRDAGVDSVSFRPVFHGLGGEWTDAQLAELADVFAEAATLDRRPDFGVHLPRRDLRESGCLDPNEHFEHCHSRHLRTVLEATSAGLTVQSCGMYRGTGSAGRASIRTAMAFDAAWSGLVQHGLFPPAAPRDCSRCIDVSMNTTLAAVARLLSADQSARFCRVRLEADELAELDDGIIDARTATLPGWLRAPALAQPPA